MSASRKRIAPSSNDLASFAIIYQSDRTPKAWADFLEDYAEFEEEDEVCAADPLYGQVHYCFQWQRQAGASKAPQTSSLKMRIPKHDHVQVLACVLIYENHISLSGSGLVFMAWLRDRWSSQIAPGLIVEAEYLHDPKAFSNSSRPRDLRPPASNCTIANTARQPKEY